MTDPIVFDVKPVATQLKSGQDYNCCSCGRSGKQPFCDDIQLLVAQFASKPLMESDPVNTELVIGPRAKTPLKLAIPLFVSDMSFGALSEEAKIALATGVERAGTGICSGEGSLLPEEQQANSRYFYELASARFG